MQGNKEAGLADPADNSAAIARAFAAMVLSNVCLAFGPVSVRLAAAHADVGPVTSAFWRLGLAVPVLFVLTRVMRQPIPRMGRGMVLMLLTGGLFFAIDLGSWHIGILRTRLANATLFGNITTFTFAIYGMIIARALPSRMQGVAMTLAFGGVGLLLGRSYELSREYLVGDLFCIFAGLSYTGYLIAMGRARGILQPMPALFVSTLAGAVPMLFAALAMEGKLIPDVWWPVLALAIGSQVIGQGLLIYAIGHLPPLIIALGLLIQPIVSTALGWEFYGETLATFDWIGAAAICIALILVRRGERPAVAKPLQPV